MRQGLNLNFLASQVVLVQRQLFLKRLKKFCVDETFSVLRPDGQFHFFDQQTAESRQRLEDAQSARLGISSRSNWCSMPSTTAIPASGKGLLA
jgi:hypothetical protein